MTFEIVLVRPASSCSMRINHFSAKVLWPRPLIERTVGTGAEIFCQLMLAWSRHEELNDSL